MHVKDLVKKCVEGLLQAAANFRGESNRLQRPIYTTVWKKATSISDKAPLAQFRRGRLIYPPVEVAPGTPSPPLSFLSPLSFHLILFPTVVSFISSLNSPASLLTSKLSFCLHFLSSSLSFLFSSLSFLSPSLRPFPSPAFSILSFLSLVNLKSVSLPFLFPLWLLPFSTFSLYASLSSPFSIIFSLSIFSPFHPVFTLSQSLILSFPPVSRFSLSFYLSLLRFRSFLYLFSSLSSFHSIPFCLSLRCILPLGRKPKARPGSNLQLGSLEASTLPINYLSRLNHGLQSSAWRVRGSRGGRESKRGPDYRIQWHWHVNKRIFSAW